jgi:hypothetical protein
MQNLQSQHTELTAGCGHQIFVRLDVNPVVAADMIATFMARDCGRSTCPAAQANKATRLPTRGITWADLGSR